jgi:hypothetical protein
MNYWKGLLFMGGYLSVASVLADVAREAQATATAPDEDDLVPTTPQSAAATCA